MTDEPSSRTRDDDRVPADEDERLVVTGPLVVIALIALLIGVAAGIVTATKAVAP